MTRRLPLALLFGVACTAPIPEDPGASLDAASTTPVARVTRDGRTTAIRGTIPTGESDARRSADVFLADHSAAIGVEDPARDLEHRESQVHPTTSTNPDAREEVVIVYDGQQDGHRVYGSEVRVIVRNGEIVYAGGSTTEDASSLGTARISAEGAFVSYSATQDSSERNLRDSELVAFNLGIFIKRPTLSVLAWLLDVESPAGPSRVFVDARTGEELLTISGVQRAYASNVYTMRGVTADLRPDYFRSGTLTYANGALVPGASSTTATRNASAYAEAAYNYFQNIHSRDGYDEAGSVIDVHVGAALPGAYWIPEMQRLVFGQRWLSDDILAHEFTHGVIQYAAGIEYLFESGSLNESIADLFGEFATGSSTWLLGEGSARGTLRSLRSPRDYGQPDHYGSRQASGSFDACDAARRCASGERCITGICVNNDLDPVHTNSGIPNRALYLMTDGGSASGVSVEGIGQPKVEHLVYRTLATALGKTSDFMDFRFSLRNAAMCFVENGEYDFSYEDCGSVLDAMAAVGVGAPDRDSDCFDDDVDNCPCVYNPDQDPEACSGDSACTPQCERIGECGACGEQEGCGWCDGECTSDPSCAESCATIDACETHNTCSACGEADGCGWCGDHCQSDATACLNEEGREVPYTHQNLCCAAPTTCGDCLAEGCSWCGFCAYNSDTCFSEVITTCGPTCDSLATCAACASTDGCGWTDDGCTVATEIGGIDGGLTTDPSRCEASDPCSVGTDCEMCAQTAGCGWGAEGCVTASPGNPDVITRAAECVDCSGLSTCTPCATNGFCEWCSGSGCHNTYENACESPTPVLVCAIEELPD